MEPKHIVILSEDFPPHSGGIAQWAAGVAQRFHDLGHHVRVITRFWEQYQNVPQQQYGFSVEYIRKKHWKRLRTLYWRSAIKRVTNNAGSKPDLIIATTWNAARGICTTTRKKQILLAIVIHGLEITRKMGVLKKCWCQSTLEKADWLIAVSHFTRDRVISSFSVQSPKTLLIPNGISLSLFSPQPGDSTDMLKKKLGLENHKVILTLSRVVERKGHDRVIEALPAVLEKVPDVKYIIAGDPQGAFIDTLKQRVKKLNLENRVIFTGRLRPDEIVPCYNLCDVYIMPSREIAGQGDTEGFGITYLEANACGKPVIGGNSGGGADAIEDGVSGFLVDPNDVREIAQKLTLLLTDDALAKKMGQAGRERIEKGFTWDAVGDRILSGIF